MKKKPLSITEFETALNKLNAIIDDMESGKLSLEKSLQHFEEGIALVQACQQTLTDASSKVQTLMEKHD